jgi:hypothetical protein
MGWQGGPNSQSSHLFVLRLLNTDQSFHRHSSAQGITQWDMADHRSVSGLGNFCSPIVISRSNTIQENGWNRPIADRFKRLMVQTFINESASYGIFRFYPSDSHTGLKIRFPSSKIFYCQKYIEIHNHKNGFTNSSAKGILSAKNCLS